MTPHFRAFHKLQSVPYTFPFIIHPMKNLLFLAVMCFLASCGQPKSDIAVGRYIIETKAPLQEGKTNDVLELFKSTNPQLVSDESDWIRASFSKVEEKNMVIVRAEWSSKESYLKFSGSDKFKETMGQFG
jgi:heme-degrading monooxygenase HmoA